MDAINIGMQLVFSAVKTYTSLQELMSNFRTIIVPEAANSFLKVWNHFFKLKRKRINAFFSFLLKLSYDN